MADVKKVLSLNQLSKYDALLKAKMLQDDAVILDSAKDYVDSAIENAASAKIELDTTLSIEGKAADAKAVGDVIARFAPVATSGSYNDLTNKPSIPDPQVNSDWNATSGVAKILNKPTLAAVATSGSYTDLTDKPTIPTVYNATLTIQKNGSEVGTFT